MIIGLTSDAEKSLEDLSESVPEILVNIPQPDEG